MILRTPVTSMNRTGSDCSIWLFLRLPGVRLTPGFTVTGGHLQMADIPAVRGDPRGSQVWREGREGRA
ncbi:MULTISPECIES: hypothetical protein [unclassified Streptomyces]|uniref:hypothetical protein n=1 Tax=unclassified Streptomyces TaxID=2593676 RepID=UPI003829AC1B